MKENKDKAIKPYYAVLFTSIQTSNNAGYTAMAEKMQTLAKEQSGFLGINSARNEIGITISYWESEAAILAWKKQVDHQVAQKMGREHWYSYYKVEIAKVERYYEYVAPSL